MGTGVKNPFSLVIAGVALTPAQRETASNYFDRIEEISVQKFYHPGALQPADAYLVNCDDNFMGALESAGVLQEKNSPAILFITEETDAAVLVCCANYGIPLFSEDAIEHAMSALYCMRLQLREKNLQAKQLQNKLDDARLVSRAKLLLMNRFKMSETEAHRYIEKTAMDHSQKRRDVAISIIRTYED